MLFENVPRPIMKEFNHRPLKKRPVPATVREETPLSPATSYDDNSEPENLSTKPEDLSRTGNYPSNATSPAIGAAPTPTPVARKWPEPAHSPPCLPQYPQHHQTYPPMTPHLPQHHIQNHIPNHMVLPMATYLPSRLSPRLPQYHHHVPLDILNLNTHEQPWSRPSPMYSACLPYAHATAETYNGLSPRAACTPPMRSPPVTAMMSPISPTSSLTSGPASPQVARPEDLTSPVSVDSGISTESIPRRRRDPTAPRYQCPDCGKSYSTYSGLTKHRQFHCAAAEGNLAKKSFSCKFCPKVYTSLGALKMHIRTHTLPCKCHLCGKAFSRPWLLQGHIRTHTGEKPFSCHHCRRAFADRSNLRAHLQTHSEVKKYSCASCSKTFSRMSLLSKHLEGGCPGCGPLAPSFDYRAEEMAY